MCRVIQGFSRDMTHMAPMMEKQMEKMMDDEMQTGGLLGFRVLG